MIPQKILNGVLFGALINITNNRKWCLTICLIRHIIILLGELMKIVFYETENGDCPLSDYLDSLNSKLLAKTLRTIDLLEQNGHL